MIDKCKVFTPVKHAKEILDYVGYRENLYGKKIIENACGDGAILQIVVERYIKDCIKNNFNLEKIKNGLEKDIFGVEYDIKHYENCLINLENIANNYKIFCVNWNIFNENTLKKQWSIKFDYVVGNPPYISYRDLEPNIRKELKEKYNSCKKGRFDYCYAFIEESLNCLNETGKMAYLIPNSIFKNTFGQNLRTVLLPSLSKIVNFTTKKIFKTALVSAAIIVCEKKQENITIEYEDVVNNEIIKLRKSDLGERWFFKQCDPIKNCDVLRFGDYFNASMTIATLCNEAYIVKEYEITDQYVWIGKLKIERKLLKKSASPQVLKKGKNEFIIFPYQYKNNKLVKYEEEDFNLKFPEGAKYLKQFKSKLLKRDSDKNSKWFEYGRSQALGHLNCAKLLFSSLITSKINIYTLSEDYIPYSGIYVTAKSNLSLDIAKKILESDEFMKYIKKVGKNGNSHTLKIGVKDINNFIINKNIIESKIIQ